MTGLIPHVEPARLFECPDNPIPTNAHGFWVLTADGTRIRGAAAEAHGAARGTVLLLQGRMEVIEKYFEVMGDLQARGFHVLTLDWRGQGGSARALSDGHKGHVDHFDDFMADLSAVLGATAGWLKPPLVILAHSMGGNVALQALRDWPDRFAGAVLTAPMTGINLPLPWLARILVRFAPITDFVPGPRINPFQEHFEINLVTNDRRRFDRRLVLFRTFPALAVGSPTWGWVRAAIEASDRVMAPGFLEAIAAPVLVLSAEDERLVDNPTQVIAAKRLPHGKLELFHGAKHELLMETDAVRSEVWAKFDAFVAPIAPKLSD